jgi:hypothetical protein
MRHNTHVSSAVIAMVTRMETMVKAGMARLIAPHLAGITAQIRRTP